MRNLSATILILAYLAACSDNQESKSPPVGELIAEKQYGSAEQKPVVAKKKDDLSLTVQDKIIKEDKKGFNKKVLDWRELKKYNNIVINKQKFELKSSELIKGAEVFNLLMSEPGIVKGTFVVIASNAPQLTHFDKTERIIKIAKSTYRMTPEEGVDFLGYYKSLLATKQFLKVEMEIDYSGATRRSLTKER